MSALEALRQLVALAVPSTPSGFASALELVLAVRSEFQGARLVKELSSIREVLESLPQSARAVDAPTVARFAQTIDECAAWKVLLSSKSVAEAHLRISSPVFLQLVDHVVMSPRHCLLGVASHSMPGSDLLHDSARDHCSALGFGYESDEQGGAVLSLRTPSSSPSAAILRIRERWRQTPSAEGDLTLYARRGGSMAGRIASRLVTPPASIFAERVRLDLEFEPSIALVSTRIYDQAGDLRFEILKAYDPSVGAQRA